MGRVLAITNQKGGVGKSTTAVNLAAALAEAGRRVLVVDVDPQGNTTSGLGVEKGGLDRCIYDVLLEECPLEEVLIETSVSGLLLAPATLRLAGAEIELVSAISREARLARALQAVKPRFDHVFLDCPPSLGLLTVNAMTAADGLLIPIQCEFYALEGLTQLLNVMGLVRKHLNRAIEVEGVLLTMHDARLNLTVQVAEEVRRHFESQLFETVIPRNVKLGEAPSFGQPVLAYDPRSRGAEAYRDLAKEVMQREQARVQQPQGARERTVGADPDRSPRIGGDPDASASPRNGRSPSAAAR